ncbi:MAG: MFS transporter [Patescibacteria group bacterium]
MPTHDENLEKGKVRLVGFISFLMGFSQAMLVYVMAYYFKIASGTEDVGLFYLVAYSVLLIILLNLHKIIRILGKSAVFYFSIIGSVIVSSFLIFSEPSFLGIFFLMLYIIFTNLAFVSLDVILESFSTDKMSGRIRGLHLTVINAGYLIGPFLSTRILQGFDFRGIFIFLLIFNSFILIISLLGLRNVNHKFDVKLKVKDLVGRVFKNKDITKVYYLAFTLDFFYALMVIYTSIYLLNQGISWNQIGVIFTIMLVPFVILQYPIGFLADKRMGEKELLIVSLIFMAISTLVLYFTHSSQIWVWGVVLLATRIGASMLEVLRDSYFYKKIDGHDVDLINFFRTSMPVGYIVATAISFPLLLVFPIKIVFVLVSLVVISALIPAFLLKDNKCEKEME